MTPVVTYDVVTPARDELVNLQRLADSLIAQETPPRTWVIVDNGSVDGTRELAESLAQEHSFVVVTDARGDASARPGAPIVRAFHAGLAALDDFADVVVKVDADVSFSPPYFTGMLAAFSDQPALGIASGACFELDGDVWKATRVTGDHVRGAARAYRRECLESLLPLPERAGWDTIDELQANVAGWETKIVPALRFDHHRAVGARDGSRTSRWLAKGRAAHYLGYRPSYLAFRALYNARRDPAALAMLWGYIAAACTRQAQLADTAAREHLRRRQSLRELPKRVRELRSPLGR